MALLRPGAPALDPDGGDVGGSGGRVVLAGALHCASGMIGTLVDYLFNARVPFRLASYPSEEARPIAGHPRRPDEVLVDTRLFLVEGRPVLSVFPASEGVEPSAISAALGGEAVVATNDDLPHELRRFEGSLPPLGQLFGIPLVVDERVARASVIVFRAFAESVYFEVPYEDFGRLEQPRLAPIASAGVLGAGL